MADITFTVDVERAKQALEALPANLRRKVIRGALRAAARPIVLAARGFAPVLKMPTKRRVPGTIKRNIQAFGSKKANGRNGTIGVYVTVKASKRDLKKSPISGDPYYWRWLEGGHRIVPRTKRVGTRFGKALNKLSLRYRRASSSGSVRPYPFLAPAFRAKAPEAVRVFEREIFTHVAKANALTVR